MASRRPRRTIPGFIAIQFQGGIGNRPSRKTSPNIAERLWRPSPPRFQSAVRHVGARPSSHPARLDQWSHPAAVLIPRPGLGWAWLKSGNLIVARLKRKFLNKVIERMVTWGQPVPQWPVGERCIRWSVGGRQSHQTSPILHLCPLPQPYTPVEGSNRLPRGWALQEPGHVIETAAR